MNKHWANLSLLDLYNGDLVDWGEVARDLGAALDCNVYPNSSDVFLTASRKVGETRTINQIVDDEFELNSASWRDAADLAVLDLARRAIETEI
jgi:hypothetical protein